MKKLSTLGMAAVIAAGLAGCSGPAETTIAADSKTETQAEAKTEAQADRGESQAGGAYAVTDPVEIAFATQDAKTAAHIYAPAMANPPSDAFPSSSVVDMTTTSPGGVGSSVILGNKQYSVTVSNSAPAKWVAGTGILGSPPTESIRELVGDLDKVIPNVIFTQSFVDRTGITTVEELVVQKYPAHIAVKSFGVFRELACNKMFGVLGVSYEDIEPWGGSVTQTGSDAIVSLSRDGKTDMTIDYVAPGQSVTSELYMTTRMHSPQLSDDTLEKLTKEGFGYTVAPARTQSGQEIEIKIAGSPRVMPAFTDLDDAIVYTMAKALCENAQTLVNTNVALETFDPEIAQEPVKLGAPIHPGAETYYRGMGYMKWMKFV